MARYDNILDAIGNTPLIKLRRVSEKTGCTILGKAEFLNPGGSVKDRAAKYMILDAEERGDLRPGELVTVTDSGLSAGQLVRMSPSEGGAP